MATPYTQNLTQSLSLLAHMDAGSVSAGSTSTSAIDMGGVRRIVAVVNVGTMGTSSTVDFKFQGCATSGGTFVDIDSTNCKIVQVQQAASGSGTISELELRAEYINTNNTGTPYRYVKGVLTVGTAASPVSVVVYGSVARHEPASMYNTTGVNAPVVY